jgi:hypothetical protein
MPVDVRNVIDLISTDLEDTIVNDSPIPKHTLVIPAYSSIQMGGESLAGMMVNRWNCKTPLSAII